MAWGWDSAELEAAVRALFLGSGELEPGLKQQQGREPCRGGPHKADLRQTACAPAPGWTAGQEQRDAEAGCWALLQRHPLACVLLTPNRAWRGRCALRTTDQIQELFPRCSAGPCGLSSTGTKSRCLRVVGPAWRYPVWSRRRSGLAVNRVVEGWCFHRLLFLPRLAPGLTPFPGRGIPSASFPQGRTSEPVCCLPAASP